MSTKHQASILYGTSTFFRLYIRNKKLHQVMFQNMRIVIAGAEKLKTDVKEAFRLKFGLEILEGYGTTETAPVASVDMPLLSTIIKIVDPEILAEQPPFKTA